MIHKLIDYALNLVDRIICLLTGGHLFIKDEPTCIICGAQRHGH